MGSLLGVVIAPPAYPKDGSLSRHELTPLTAVGNRSILERVIGGLHDAHIEDVVLAVDAAYGDRVRDVVRDGSALGVRARYVALDGWYGHAHAISQAVDQSLDRPVVFHAAGGLLGQPIDRLVDRFDTEGLDALVSAPGAGASDPPSLGFGVLGPAVLRGLRELRSNWRGEFDISEALGRISDGGGKVVRITPERWWHLDGTPTSLLAGNRFVLEALRPGDPCQVCEDSHIDGRVNIHATARVVSSVIHGPVSIAAGATVTDAYIGPYTSIGAGATVDGAEIEDSVVMVGALIRHVGARLAGCVIGRDARVFRSFSLPRATRVFVGDATEVAFV